MVHVCGQAHYANISNNHAWCMQIPPGSVKNKSSELLLHNSGKLKRAFK
jgi:hypothetical protein